MADEKRSNLWRIKCPDGLPQTTDIFGPDGSGPLHGISAIDIRMRPGEVARATLELCEIATDIEAEATVLIRHPVLDDFRAVRRIEFADGTVWSAE